MRSFSTIAGVLILVFTLFSAVACDGPRTTETQAFETAEAHYKGGDYEVALAGYESFLKLYPTSPLAGVARTRIRNIRREVDSMLGRSEGLRPVYHKPGVHQGSDSGAD